MRIETKRSIGDTVYVCSDSQIRRCVIEKISCEVHSNGAVHVSYLVKDQYGSTLQRDDRDVFDTVDELVESFNL